MAKSELKGWPADFLLTDDMALYAKEKGLDALDQFEAFHDSALANDRRYADWKAAWRTWCRNCIRFAEKTGTRPGFRIDARPIGFTRPAALPSHVREALADNEAARVETANMTKAQTDAARDKMKELVRAANERAELKRLSAIQKEVKRKGEW